MTTGERRSAVLDALRAAGWAGLMVPALSKETGIPARSVQRLVSELEKAGLLRRSNERGSVVLVGLDPSSPGGPVAAESRAVGAAEVAMDVRGKAAGAATILRVAAEQVDPRLLSSPLDVAAAAEVRARLRARADELGRVRRPEALMALTESARDDLQQASVYIAQGNKEGPLLREQKERGRSEAKKRKGVRRVLEGQLDYLQELLGRRGITGERPLSVLRRIRIGGEPIATFTETIQGETPVEKIGHGLFAALTDRAIGVDREWSSTFDPAIRVSDRSLRQWGESSQRLLAPAITWLENELSMQAMEGHKARELKAARSTFPPTLLGHALKETPLAPAKPPLKADNPPDEATSHSAGSVKTGVYKTGSRKTERCGRDGNPTAMVLEWGPVDQWDNETRAACSAECAASFEQEPELSVLGPARRRLV